MFSNILVEKFKVLIKCIFFSVSHTTDDLVFQWLPDEKVPLAVDQGIELPQLELVSNYTGDCTSVYSTGNLKKAGKFKLTKKKRKLSGSFFLATFLSKTLLKTQLLGACTRELKWKKVIDVMICTTIIALGVHSALKMQVKLGKNIEND